MKGKYSKRYAKMPSLAYRKDFSVDVVIKAIYEGKEAKQIAKEFDVSKTTVYQRLREYGMNFSEIKKLIKESATLEEN